MDVWCYVLVEGVIQGCLNKIRIVGVTLDQNEAYIWQQAADGVTVTRQAYQVPFLS